MKFALFALVLSTSAFAQFDPTHVTRFPEVNGQDVVSDMVNHANDELRTVKCKNSSMKISFLRSEYHDAYAAFVGVGLLQNVSVKVHGVMNQLPRISESGVYQSTNGDFEGEIYPATVNSCALQIFYPYQSLTYSLQGGKAPVIKVQWGCQGHTSFHRLNCKVKR